MSIIAGYLGEGFSVVATDTRTTNIAVKEKFNDEAKKLNVTNFGWVAESGGVSLSTTFFNNLLNSNNIKTRKQIYTCWLMAIRETLRFSEKHLAPKLYSEVDQEVNSSQAIYSLNYFTDGAAHIEIETIDFAYGKRKALPNTLITQPPKNTKRINRVVEECSKMPVDSIHSAIYVIACLIDDIAKLTPFINNHVDAGISFRVSESEILFMRLSENARAIKRLYKQWKNLSTIMMVCGSKVMI